MLQDSRFMPVQSDPETVLNHLNDPVLAYGQDFALAHANRAAAVLFQISEPESALTVLDLFRQGEVKPAALAEWQHHHTLNQPFHQEITLYGKQFSLACTPLATGDWVCMLHDISAVKAREALHTQMIQIVSHDLKNPLNIIIGLGSVLAKEETGERLKWVQQIIHNCRRMEALITNLLNIEKINAGYLEITEFDPCNFLNALLAEYEAEARDKDHLLEIDLEPCQHTLQADRAQLHQALGNLLSNAIKYTPRNGTIYINLTMDEQHVRFSVRDNGIGIPQDALDKLFQPFFRVQSTSTQGIPGTGLGLNLARSIVNAHGGQIWVQTAEGQGSTFIVELPLVQEKRRL